ncbi:serine/threonine-protein phosphatase BSL1 homolog [Curcuma longa]|uniref:serine/threonine-protein phosphatase BSL1 homolog n=1 Tax=Curcuma longa TaxID=136217 RepID=UPI003D9F1355
METDVVSKLTLSKGRISSFFEDAPQLWNVPRSGRARFGECHDRGTCHGQPLSDAYGLLMHTNGQWEWTLAPGVSPSPRYQHAAVFVGARLHVTGGALKGGRNVEGEASIAVLDTAAGVWLDRNGIVTSTRTHKSPTDHDGCLELLRRCRHALASVGTQVYVYGGLKGAYK